MPIAPGDTIAVDPERASNLAASVLERPDRAATIIYIRTNTRRSYGNHHRQYCDRAAPDQHAHPGGLLHFDLALMQVFPHG